MLVGVLPDPALQPQVLLVRCVVFLNFVLVNGRVFPSVSVIPFSLPWLFLIAQLTIYMVSVVLGGTTVVHQRINLIY